MQSSANSEQTLPVYLIKSSVQSSTMFSKRITTISMLAVSLIAFGLGVGLYSANYYKPDTEQAITGMLWPNPKQLRHFATVDHAGEIFGLNELRGKWSFLFFGYTHCPDVCPLTLAVLDQVHQQLGIAELAGDVQIIFVSVDTARDQPQQLAEYVSYFNKDFIGLGGTPEQVQSLASQIGVLYIIGKEAADGEYLVDHSASVFLIDPDGRLIAIFSAPHQANSIAARFEKIKTFLKKHS